MNAAEQTRNRPSNRKARMAGAAGLIAAGAVVGGVLAGTSGAVAATSSSSASPSASTTTTQPAAGSGVPAQTSTPVRTDEQTVTSTIAATLKTKALAAVPGGTVYRIETDAGDAAYEAHLTKSDGSLVTVKFDKNLNLIGIENGMGQGDPAGPNGPPGDAAGSTAGTAAGTAAAGTGT